MTFTPTPPDDLPSPAEYFDHQVAQAQVEASLLWHQQVFNASVLASISDLYSRIPGSGAGTARGVWHWTNNVLSAPPGSLHIDVLGATNRRVHVTKSDANMIVPDLSGVGPGDPLILMDSPGGQVTAFRQYTVSSPLVGAGMWWEFDAVRVAIFGSQDTPAEGTLVSLLLG